MTDKLARQMARVAEACLERAIIEAVKVATSPLVPTTTVAFREPRHPSYDFGIDIHISLNPGHNSEFSQLSQGPPTTLLAAVGRHLVSNAVGNAIWEVLGNTGSGSSHGAEFSQTESMVVRWEGMFRDDVG